MNGKTNNGYINLYPFFVDKYLSIKYNDKKYISGK